MTMLLRKPPKLSVEATRRFKNDTHRGNEKQQEEMKLLMELMRAEKQQKVVMKR